MSTRGLVLKNNRERKKKKENKIKRKIKREKANKKDSVQQGQGRGRKLMNFSYMHHPTKNDVTSGLNCDSRLVAQSEKMAFRLLKIPLYL